MHNPAKYVKESLGKKEWADLEKILQVVKNDYELRMKRDEFLYYLAREQYERLKAIAEWNEYLKHKQPRGSKQVACIYSSPFLNGPRGIDGHFSSTSFDV